MLAEFRQFLLPGNVVDLAVGVIIGVVFGAVITALVEGVFTPLMAAVVGQPDFSSIGFTVNQEPDRDRPAAQRPHVVPDRRRRRLLLRRHASQSPDRTRSDRAA